MDFVFQASSVKHTESKLPPDLISQHFELVRHFHSLGLYEPGGYNEGEKEFVFAKN